MNAYDFVHLSLLALGGRVEGRTKLQKQVYFLGIMTGCEEDLGYRAHYYGPYSDAVSEAVGQLRELDFLSTQSATWGIDARGFEITRTDYSLTPDGKEIAQRKAHQNPELWMKLQEAVDILLKAGDLDYVRLSVAAKTYFMLGQCEHPLTRNRAVELAKDFGWNVTEEQVAEAFSHLESFGLVQLQPAS